MTWKKVNQSDAGTASKFGGNDVDKISDAFSGTDVDDIDMNCDFTARDNKLHYRNPANTFSYNIRTSAIAANRDVTEPLLTSNDTRVYQAHTQTLTNKTFDIRDNSFISRENSYLIFKDGSTYYARNGTTGALTSNSAFSTLFQNIINAIPTRDDTVFTKIKIAPGTYDINTTITIADKYNLSIQGSGMGITRLQAGPSLGGTAKIFDIKGSVSGTQKNLTSNTINQSKDAVMSSGDASTFAVADWVLVRSLKDFFATAPSGKQGEIKQIASISAGTITFREPLHDIYLTADTANIIKLLPMRNLSMSDFTLGRHASYTGTDAQWWEMFLIHRGYFHGIEIVDAPGDFRTAMIFISCIDIKISDCHLQQNIAYNFQYGISFHSCCQNCVVSNCTSHGDWRHPFEAGAGETGTNQEGICRNIKFVNCVGTGGSQNTFNAHPEGEGIFFINCGTFGTNDGGGLKIRSRRSGAIGCIVQGCNVSASGQDAIMVSDNADNCIIQGCQILNNNCDGIAIKDGLDNTSINNCIIDSNTGNGIYTESGSFGTIIQNNQIKNNTIDGISVANTDSSMFENNMIRNNGAYGIDFEAGTCTNNMIVGNFFSGNTSGQVRNGAQTGNIEASNKGY